MKIKFITKEHPEATQVAQYMKLAVSTVSAAVKNCEKSVSRDELVLFGLLNLEI